jgi:hypothetical protein
MNWRDYTPPWWKANSLALNERYPDEVSPSDENEIASRVTHRYLLAVKYQT